MNPRAYMTTSWDDGHPVDNRLAAMLASHGLAGTFYIPKRSQTETMREEDIHAIAARFEIGAHTMRHTFLDGATDLAAQREIAESKTWVEDVTGKPCKMFCPPAGKFEKRDLQYMREAGYLGMRSVELMSIGMPQQVEGVFIMPTSVHAYPHRPLAYVKNSLKRRTPQNLWRYIVQGRMAGWDRLAISLLEDVATQGGVFHLWGHSWEIEETAQWDRLEEVLNLMASFKKQLPCLTNSQVCEAAREAALSESDVQPATA